jgi:hypothetical protein
MFTTSQNVSKSMVLATGLMNIDILYTWYNGDDLKVLPYTMVI